MKYAIQACAVRVALVLSAVAALGVAAPSPLRTAEEELTVGRWGQPTVDLDQDRALAIVAAEVAQFRAGSGGAEVDLVELVDFLAARHALVWQLAPDETEYYYVIGPDGEVYRICVMPARIAVQDAPGETPILVTLDRRQIL